MNSSGALGTGAIVGIAVGVLCLLLLCVATMCFFMRSSKEAEDKVMEMNRVATEMHQSGPNFDAENDIYLDAHEPNFAITETHAVSN